MTMAAAATSPFAPRPLDARRANRAISWSIAIHVAAVLAAFVLPRSWFARKAAPPVMTITLGGAPGPRTTGTTSIGGRTIEQAVPTPKRPEPVPPTPKAAPVPMPALTPPRMVDERTARTPKPPPMPAVRAPITGPQVTTGSSPVDTGARGQGTGLTSSGRGLGGEVDLPSDFCCPEYLTEVLSTIDGVWKKNQEEVGTTVLKFTLHRDGRVTDIIVERPSGYGVLDRASRAALDDARLPRLPPAYTRDTLTIHLTFPYGTQ